MDAKNKRLSVAIQRIWAGERDWQYLAAGLEREEALLFENEYLIAENRILRSRLAGFCPLISLHSPQLTMHG